MELVLEIPAYHKEHFLEYASSNSTVAVESTSSTNKGGLQISIPELITVVSTTVVAIDLTRLLLKWLNEINEETLVIKLKNVEAQITITRALSEYEIARLISTLAEIDEQ